MKDLLGADREQTDHTRLGTRETGNDASQERPQTAQEQPQPQQRRQCNHPINMSVIGSVLEELFDKVRQVLCADCKSRSAGDDDADEPTVLDHSAANLTSDFAAQAFESSGDSLRLCGYYLTWYILVAIVAYSFVFEKWTVIDSIYFSVVTILTVGYGDLYPTTTAGRIFTSVFAMAGMTILGIFLGIVGHALVKLQEDQMEAIERTTQQKMLGLVSDEHREKDVAQKQQSREQMMQRLPSFRKPTRGASVSSSITNSVFNSANTDDGRMTESARLVAIEEDSQNSNVDNTDAAANTAAQNDVPITDKADEEEVTIFDDIAGVIWAVGPTMLLLVTVAVVLGCLEHWSVVTSIYFSIVEYTKGILGKRILPMFRWLSLSSAPCFHSLTHSHVCILEMTFLPTDILFVHWLRRRCSQDANHATLVFVRTAGWRCSLCRNAVSYRWSVRRTQEPGGSDQIPKPECHTV